MINPNIIGLMVVGIVAIVLLVFAIKPQQRLPEEKGLIALYNTRCTASRRTGFGFRFGSNMPICRITLYDHAMVMAVWTPVLVKYDDIENVKCERSWLSRRLKVSTRTPKMVVSFNIRSPEKIVNVLRDKGVKIINS